MGFVSKRRQSYSSDDLRGALQKVLEEKQSIYKAAENLSYYRANNANREVLNDFYDKLKECYDKVGSTIKPSQIWNCDETGLSYVVKSDKVVTKVVKKYVYNRVIADKAETHTVLPCVNAAGEFGPLLIIFKGVRMSAALSSGFMKVVSSLIHQMLRNLCAIFAKMSVTVIQMQKMNEK